MKDKTAWLGWNWLSRKYGPERMLFCPVNAAFSKLSPKRYCSTITTGGLTALGVLKYIVLGLWRSLLTPSACLPSNLSYTSSKCQTCHLGSQVDAVLNIQTEWQDKKKERVTYLWTLCVSSDSQSWMLTWQLGKTKDVIHCKLASSSFSLCHHDLGLIDIFCIKAES